MFSHEITSVRKWLFLLRNTQKKSCSLFTICNDSILRIPKWRTKKDRGENVITTLYNDIHTVIHIMIWKYWLCLFIEMYVISDCNLDVNKDYVFLKLANELDSERISKTNKQQREESQFLSSHKGLMCPYWRTFTQSTKHWNTNTVTERNCTHLYTPWARRHKSHLSVFSVMSQV